MWLPRGGFSSYGGWEATDRELSTVTLLFGATGADLRLGLVNSPDEISRIQNDGDVQDEPFVWVHPIDRNDALAGGTCAATGYRAAGHAMVWRNGKHYIAEFAPRNNPDKQ